MTFLHGSNSARRRMTVRPNLPNTIGYKSGLWYGPALIDAVTASPATVTGDTDIFVPFLCRQTKTFDRISVYNTAANTEPLRLAIYPDDGFSPAASLILDSGEMTTSGAAGLNSATITFNAVENTLYWLAFNCTNSIAFTSFEGGTAVNMADFGLPTGPSVYAVGNGLQAARSYAAFPSTPTTPTGVIGRVPIIMLRAA